MIMFVIILYHVYVTWPYILGQYKLPVSVFSIALNHMLLLFPLQSVFLLPETIFGGYWKNLLIGCRSSVTLTNLSINVHVL